MWVPDSLGVSGKTLKHKVKFTHKLTDSSKRPYFIHRFCDEISTAAASAKAMASVIIIAFIFVILNSLELIAQSRSYCRT
jgi:hypothetical protein